MMDPWGLITCRGKGRVVSCGGSASFTGNFDLTCDIDGGTTNIKRSTELDTVLIEFYSRSRVVEVTLGIDMGRLANSVSMWSHLLESLHSRRRFKMQALSSVYCFQ
jgi:hypothetical protein